MTEHYLRRVSPFGYPWINACLRLPMAFRSLPRPSSAISALASTLRSYSLDLCLCHLPSLLRLKGRQTTNFTTIFVLFSCAVFKVRIKGLSRFNKPATTLQSDTVKVRMERTILAGFSEQFLLRRFSFRLPLRPRRAVRPWDPPSYSDSSSP